MQTETIENPVIKPDNEIGQSLRDLAAQVDNGVVDGDTAEFSKASEVKDVSEPVHDEGPPEPEGTTERPRDEKGRFTSAPDKTEAADPKAEAKAPETVVPTAEAPKSDYEKAKAVKAQKEQERLDKTWENANRIKDEVAREKAELERLREELKKPQAPKIEPLVDAYGQRITSQQLGNAYRDFKQQAKRALEQGDYDEFNKFDQLAEQAWEGLGTCYAFEQQERQTQAQAQWDSEWKADMGKVISEIADAGNPDSPLGQEIQKLWSSPHLNSFRGMKDGFRQMVAVAQLHLKANESDAYRIRAEKAEAALTERDKATSLAGGGVTTPQRPKGFEDLSHEEQGRRLRSAISEYDSGN